MGVTYIEEPVQMTDKMLNHVFAVGYKLDVTNVSSWNILDFRLGDLVSGQ